VALWRHWPGDDQRPADLAAAVVEFQERWDWDFVKVTPASSYCLVDYGVEDRWVGHLEGTREYTERVIVHPMEWTTLPTLDPSAGGLGAATEALKLIQSGLGNVPIIHTIFNPLSQAKNLIGQDFLLEHLRDFPDHLKAGLQTITDNTLRYLDVLKRETDIAGIFFAVQHASTDIMSLEEYEAFGAAYDRQIMDGIAPKWWFNMLHLHGDNPMLDVFFDYPVQAVNWHDRETSPAINAGVRLVKGAVCGGLGRWDAVHNGTPDDVRAQAQDAIQKMGGVGHILSTGCVMMTTTPISNIRAVRESV
jgi:uroporphyrinogen decarboxylase